VFWQWFYCTNNCNFGDFLVKKAIKASLDKALSVLLSAENSKPPNKEPAQAVKIRF
jgi:hypothetical protein